MKKQDLREGISHERIYGFDMLNDNTSPFLRIALGISGVSISAASFLSYIFLQKTGFHHAFIIAGLMFAGSIFWFWHRWKGEKGKAYLLKRFSEIPQTILENRSKGIRG